MKIHFIGINGSGASGVAIAAKKMGFDVSGCDPNMDTPYAAQVRNAGIPVSPTHDAAHAWASDIVAASPAAMQSEEIAEINAAKSAGKLIKWQEFLGRYILPGRRVVAVSGTHGKTTTSSMMAHVMVCADLDPTAFIGAIVPAWNSSNRFGASDWTVLEADEYANNFASYHPDFIILNNIEMEHPEYFKDFEHYKQTFRDFLAGAAPRGVLIYNADDANAAELSNSFPGKKIPSGISGIKINADEHGQDFEGFHINLLGRHNVSNAMAVITCAREIGIDDDVIRRALSTFHGAGHRLEKVFENGAITIFDDYAHHHTQAKTTIAAIRASFPDSKLIVVYEPHQISRYAQNTAETLAVLDNADVAIITEFWRGREAALAIPDVGADIKKFGTNNVRYISDISATVDAALESVHGGKSVILVMGAGQSWKIAKALKEKLK